jgi:septal ring factor EnvC (AmiA/AmiB activator)
MTQTAKTFVRDWLPIIVLSVGIVGSWSNLMAKHDEAMRRITSIESKIAEDHDKVTAQARDLEYIRKTVDEIKAEVRNIRAN